MKYFLTGTGPDTLVLIHGYCSDYLVWQFFEKEMAKTHKVLVFSIPGYLSEEETYTENLGAIAQEINKVLVSENIEKAHFVGHSMGGYIALEFLEQHENKVSALTLLNSHCYTDNEDKKVNRSKTIDFIRKHGTGIYLREIYKTLFSEQFQNEHPEIIQAVKERAKEYSVETLVRSSKAMIERKNHTKTLSKTKVPVQFILGAKDSLIPLEDFVQQASIPSIASLKIFPEMGHMGMHESPETTLTEILSFNEYATKMIS